MRLSAILTEAQIDYLTKKYGGQVAPELIAQAIAVSPPNAEKLVFAYAKGLITAITPEVVAQVQNVDPFDKGKVKSPAEIQYAKDVAEAKEISRQYWQWVLKVKKAGREADPPVETVFKPEWFHWLAFEEPTPDELMRMTPEMVDRKSTAWHAKLAKQQASGSRYSLKPGDEGTHKLSDNYWMVPVTTVDARIEGSKMGNCIGSGCHPSDTTKIFSLRDLENMPHVSVSIIKDYGSSYRMGEIKGRSNKVPIPKYASIILPWLASLVAKDVVPGGSDLGKVVNSALLHNQDNAKYIPTFLKSASKTSNGTLSFLSEISTGLNSHTMAGFLGEALRVTPFSQDNAKQVHKLVANQGFDSESVLTIMQSADPKFAAFIIAAALSNGGITVPQAQELLTTTGAASTLGLQMLMISVSDPQRFLATVQSHHPNDLLNSPGFDLALSTYSGPKSPVFSEFLGGPTPIVLAAARHMPIEDLTRAASADRHGFAEKATESIWESKSSLFHRISEIFTINNSHGWVDTAMGKKMYASIFMMSAEELEKLLPVCDLYSRSQVRSVGYSDISIQQLASRMKARIQMLLNFLQAETMGAATQMFAHETEVTDKDQLLAIANRQEDPESAQLAKLKLAALSVAESGL